MKQFQQLSLKTFQSRGYALTPIEYKDLIPFEVKRTYFITHFESGANTGEHCHFVEDEMFCVVKGTVDVVIDRGQGKELITLTGPHDAIYTPSYVWHGFKNASPDCVIVALSSTNYSPDRSDYLENYDEYLKVRDEHLAK